MRVCSSLRVVSCCSACAAGIARLHAHARRRGDVQLRRQLRRDGLRLGLGVLGPARRGVGASSARPAAFANVDRRPSGEVRSTFERNRTERPRRRRNAAARILCRCAGTAHQPAKAAATSRFSQRARPRGCRWLPTAQRRRRRPPPPPWPSSRSGRQAPPWPSASASQSPVPRAAAPPPPHSS